MESGFRFEGFEPSPVDRRHLELGVRSLEKRVACCPRKHAHVDVRGRPRDRTLHPKVTLQLPHRQLFTGESDHRVNFLSAWRRCLKKPEAKLEARQERLSGKRRDRHHPP